MPNFSDLRTLCLESQRLTHTVIDDFLIYYGARQDNLNRKAKKKLARYSHVSRDLPEEWTNMVMTQFIGHVIFKQDGLINRYINHSGLDHLLDEEMAFLEFQAENPWRFSFAEIAGQPAEDFFEMKDVFTDDTYLLFSPGLSDILASQNISLCFNLVSYNGECWETYGPISAYNGFEPSDIRFFATQVNRGNWFENDRELMEYVESNPVPFMHLFAGAIAPRAFHIDDQIVHVTAEYLDDSFDAELFKDRFKVEYSMGVYKLSQEGWNMFPHFTAAYYNEKEELLFLYSMTDRGFRYLVKELNSCGYDLSFQSDFRVNTGMVQLTNDLLKKEINMNPYSFLFTSEPPEEDNRHLDKINTLLSGMVPLVNAGKKPDLEMMSITHDVPFETVQALYDRLKESQDQ
ncbi:hypothetical protein [Rhodohalobacter sp. 8-1]|uniref:hypothetical protein n=1 Tax=Rhodohalobacter sp. 8-1 TaxID=3131972 RepID=UPI0030EEFB0D